MKLVQKLKIGEIGLAINTATYEFLWNHLVKPIKIF